jgi:hypothetical protein
VLDEDSLAIGDVIPSCIPPPEVHRGLGSYGVAVDQAAGRVFARIWEGDNDNTALQDPSVGPELDYACILVIEDTWPRRPVRRHLAPSKH